MKWDNFTNRMKGEMPSHQSTVDVDAIWKAIEPQVDAINAKKKKKQGGTFWWGITGFLMIVMMGFLFFQTPEQAPFSAIQSDSEMTGVEKSERSSSAKTTTQSIADQESDVKVPESSTAIAADTEVLQVNVKEVISKPKPIKAINPVPAKFSTEQAAQNNLTTSSNQSANLAIAKTTSINPETEKSNEFNFTKGDIKVAEKEERVFKIKDLTNNLITANELLETIASPTAEMPDLSDQVEQLRSSMGDNFKIIKNPDFNLGIGSNGGLSASGKQLKTKGDAGNELLPLRRNSETSLETSQFGLTIDVQHRSGLGFMTGFQRTNINERYNYEVITRDTVFKEGVEFIRIELNGDSTEVIGMVPTITTTTSTKKIYNSYRMYDIPLLLSFHQEVEDWYLGIQAGVFVNLSLEASGNIADGPGSDLRLDTVQPTIFKNNVGASFYLGGSFRRALYNGWELNFSPFVRYFPKDFTTSDYVLSQKYILFGGNVGIAYRF